MAEGAGLALAVLGAFNNTIQCFDYVYLARKFDRDAQSAVLKLDIARLRLSRWGRSIGLNRVDDQTSTLPGISAPPEDHEKAQELLMHIRKLFDEAANKSSQLKIDDKVTAAEDAERDLDSTTSSLSIRLGRLATRNFKLRNLLQRTKWALYSEKHVRRLIEDIKDATDGLHELFPAAQQAQKKLCEEEAEDLAREKNVGILEPLTAEQDPDLNTAVKMSSRRIASQIFNSFEHSTNIGMQLGSFEGTQTNYFSGSGSSKS